MKIRSSVNPVVADADGTDAEENRQLTNLLLRHAIAEPVTQGSYRPKVRPAGLHFVELVFLALTFFLLKVYAFAFGGSKEDEDGFPY